MIFRPPVVTFMGHIDHGKTSLLDKIRSTNITAKEAGGITQHLTASHAAGITFIDTPGHAAFQEMRFRMNHMADIAVLVVSVVDGVMAQTKECIKSLKKTNLPIIVALNKWDLANRQPEKVKGQLLEAGLTPEEYGGQIPLIPVSAKTGQGIDQLLASIKLHAEIMELKNEPDSSLEAYVLESRLDKASGPSALVIVKKGSISIGDRIYAAKLPAKVKLLTDPLGGRIQTASGGTAVEILGFTSVPSVGALISSRITSQTIPHCSPAPTSSPASAASQLAIVLKADVAGTLEALRHSLSDDVVIIHAGIGPVLDNDIFLAQNARAQIFAFNVPVSRPIKNLANHEGVSIFTSKIIYEIIDEIQAQVLRLLEPTIDETILGQATIIAEFLINKIRIAGIRVSKGEIKPGVAIHLQRQGQIIKDTHIDSLHHGKEAVDQAKAGQDYGSIFKPYVDFKIGDVILAYKKD